LSDKLRRGRLAAAIAAGDGAAAVDATRRNVETTLLQLRGA
jgi:hypothetical protein